MNKFFKSLALIAVAAFGFASCEDVPAPYNLPSLPEKPVTVAKPITCAEAIEIVNALPDNGETTEVYEITGYIVDVFATISKGQQSFWLSDSKGGSKQIQAYWANLPDGVAAFKADTKVKITGKLMKFINTSGNLVPEMKNADVEILDNDGGDDAGVQGSKEAPLNVATAITKSGNAYVKGFIVGFVNGTKLEEGARFEVPTAAETEILIADKADEKEVAKVMPVQLPSGAIRNALELFANPSNLGKEVILYGSIETYFSVPGLKSTSWARLAGKDYGVDPDGSQVSGEAKGTGTLADPFNATAANAYISKMAADVESTEDVYIKGKISSIASAPSAQYGNASIYLSDDGSGNGDQFYGFRVFYLENQKFAGTEVLNIGDEVILCGKVVNYKGNTPETAANKAYIYSLNGKTKEGQSEGGDQGGDQGDTTGEGTEANPYNVAGALAYITTLADGEKPTNLVYTKGVIKEVVKMGTSGSIQFKMQDKDVENELLVYYCDNLGKKPFTAQTDLKAGDEVIVCGTVQNFKGNTPEYNSGSYLVSLNGKTEAEGGDQGGDQGGDKGEANEYSNGLTYTAGQNFYEQVATINSTENVQVLKIGTSSKAGDFTLTVPAGKHSFYAVSWKGSTSADVVLKKGAETFKTITVSANEGAAGNPPYTMTVSASDKYEFEVSEACTLTVTSDKRIIFFGIK